MVSELLLLSVLASAGQSATRTSAFYVHIPKTGGGSVRSIVGCARSYSTGNVSDTVKTQWMDDPGKDGVVDPSWWRATCIRYTGATCSSNHHWPSKVVGELAAAIHRRRPGSKVIVVGSIRNPFGFYVSRFMHR